MSQSPSTWEGQEPKHISIPLHGRPIPDYERLVKLSRNHLLAGVRDTVFVYSLPDFRLVHSLRRPEEELSSLDVYHNTLVTASEARETVCIWDLVSGECLHILDRRVSVLFILKPKLAEVGQNDTGEKEKWPKEPSIVMWGFQDSVFTMWNLQPPGEPGSMATDDITGRNPVLRDMGAHGHRIRCVAVSDRTAATGGFDCTVRIWDIITGDCKWIFIGHTDAVKTVDLDQSQSYSLCLDGTIRIWNLQTGEGYRILGPHTNIIYQMEISLSYLIYSPVDGTLFIRNPVSRKLIYQLTEITTSPFQHDDRKILTESQGVLKVLDVHSGRTLKVLLTYPGSLVYDIFFRSRFCIAITQRDSRHWIEVWEFSDEDGWIEEE